MLVLQGMGWEAQCGEDLRHLLHTLQHLPMDPKQAASNVGPLVNLCNTRFAALPDQPSSSIRSSTGGERARHLHRSLTENDARAQKHRDEAQPISARARQQQKLEADRETAGSTAAQETVPADLATPVGGGTQANNMLQREPHAGVGSIHGASQQSLDAANPSVSSTSQGAPHNESSQSATKDFKQHGTATSDSHSGQADQEARRAVVVLEEAADQDIDTADDGQVDMVATSTAMLADPTPAVKLVPEGSSSDTGPEFDSSVAVSLCMQPDDAR